LNIDPQDNKHVSFDLWLTLIKSDPEFKNKRNQLFKDFFEIPNNIDEVAMAIRHFDVFCNDTNQRTGLNFDTFEIYYLILDALKMDLDQISVQKLNNFYTECEALFLEYKPILIFENIESILKQLKNADLSLNILSNTAFIKGRTLRKIINLYGLSSYFDFELYSDETGFSKPSSKMFELVLTHANEIKKIKKYEILHIGDNKIADFDGAINFGFNAQLI
jgi:putative hydrolase of the HAD superfamily